MYPQGVCGASKQQSLAWVGYDATCSTHIMEEGGSDSFHVRKRGMQIGCPRTHGSRVGGERFR
jgi:hypothetical protein